MGRVAKIQRSVSLRPSPFAGEGAERAFASEAGEGARAERAAWLKPLTRLSLACARLRHPLPQGGGIRTLRVAAVTLQLRSDFQHGIERRTFGVVARDLGRRHRFARFVVAIEDIAAAGAVAPAAFVLAGGPVAEQIALRPRHPGVSLLVGQTPPLRVRHPAGVFAFHRCRPSSCAARLRSPSCPAKAGKAW